MSYGLPAIAELLFIPDFLQQLTAFEMYIVIGGISFTGKVFACVVVTQMLLF